MHGRLIASYAEKFLERILCVLAAVLFSQGPEFMQQYLQRLGGHAEEARRQVRQFRVVADNANLPLPLYIEKTRQNPDRDVASLGDVMSDCMEREQSLTRAEAALSAASAFTRPFVFVRYLDPQIAEATAKYYKPAIPTTAEGFLYAVGGLLCFLFFYHCLITAPIRFFFLRRKRSREKSRTDPPQPASNLS